MPWSKGRARLFTAGALVLSAGAALLGAVGVALAITACPHIDACHPVLHGSTSLGIAFAGIATAWIGAVVRDRADT